MRNVVYLAGIVVTIALASHFAFDASRAGTSSFYLIMAVPTVVLAIVGLFRARYDGILRHWAAVRSGDFSRGFGAAVVLFGAAYAFTKIVAPSYSPRASWLARVYLQLGDPSAFRKNTVVAILVVAVSEEILWRGLVITLLEEVIGSRRAWLWAAVLYAVAHTPTIWALRDPIAGANPTVVAAAFGCGLVWSGMARKFERLAPCVFAHALFDVAVIMMFRLWGPSA